MHRGLALSVCVCVCALALLGATPLLLNPPSVVVYPLIANGSGVNSETGDRLAVTFATEIAKQGGITVKPAPPETEQRDFLQTARRLGVDYYVMGYVTPIGNDASVLVNVVSATSGITVWSTTSQLTTYADAAGQAAAIRAAIIAYASRSINTLQPAQR